MGKGNLAARCAQRQFDEAFIERLEVRIEELGLKCIGWECRGQPGIDAIRALFEVPTREKVGETIAELLEWEVPPFLETFPLGTPQIDRYHLRASYGR